jgi:hypothetical protein
MKNEITKERINYIFDELPFFAGMMNLTKLIKHILIFDEIYKSQKLKTNKQKLNKKQ